MTIVKYMITIYHYNKRTGGGKLLISCEPFWNTLREKGVTTYALINRHNISSATIDRIKKGGGISTMKIDDFCRILNCPVEDIIQYIPDEQQLPGTDD